MQVRAATKAGLGPFSSGFKFTYPSPTVAPTAGESSSVATIAAGAGAGAAILIIIIVVIVLLRR